MRFQVVSFHCVLKNQFGRVISQSFNQDVTTLAPVGEEALLPNFAKALEKLKPGQRKEIFLAAHEAYGLYDPNLQVEAPRSTIRNGKSLKTGDVIEGSVNGLPKVHSFRVVDENPHSVVLDANHPLAGQDLIFDVEMTASREVFEKPVQATEAWMH